MLSTPTSAITTTTARTRAIGLEDAPRPSYSPRPPIEPGWCSVATQVSTPGGARTLAVQLGHIDSLDVAIERLSREIEELMRSFQEALLNLETIPAVGRRTAELLVAEVGPDMSRFPSHKHLASWAGLCPGMPPPISLDKQLE